MMVLPLFSYLCTFAAMQRDMLITRFIEKFGDGQIPKVVRAPGSVRLLGGQQHLQRGLTLAMAIDKEVRVAVRCNNSGKLSVYHNTNSTENSYDQIKQESTKSLLWMMKMMELSFNGAEILIHNDIPENCGFSAIPAQQVAMIFGISECGGIGLPDNKIIEIGYRANRQFMKNKYSLTEYSAVTKCRENHSMLFDTETAESVDIPFPEHSCIAVFYESKETYESNDIERLRQEEFSNALKTLLKIRPGLESLRDLNDKEIGFLSGMLDVTSRNRVDYYLTENKLVRDGTYLMSQGDMRGLGEQLKLSNENMVNKCDFRSEEADIIIDRVGDEDGVYGVTTLGFENNGAVLVLSDRAIVERYSADVIDIYETKLGKSLKMFKTGASEGVSIDN